MSVKEQLGQHGLEEKLHRPHDPKHNLPPELREYAAQGEGMMHIAAEFMETSGIKLALFEFNQELLDNQGRISTISGFDYVSPENGERFTYYSQLALGWKAPEGIFYSLVIGVYGDMLDTFETEDKKEDHVKNLSIALFQSENPTGAGKRIGPRIIFGKYFDIYDPSSINCADMIDNLGTDEEANKYMEMEEKEGAEDLGGNTLKNWAEANIAGFVSYVRRELRQEPLISPAA